MKKLLIVYISTVHTEEAILKKERGVAILICDRADLRARQVIRDKKGHHKMINGSIFQEVMISLHMHVPNNSIKIREAKTDGPAKRNRSTQYFS